MTNRNRGHDPEVIRTSQSRPAGATSTNITLTTDRAVVEGLLVSRPGPEGGNWLVAVRNTSRRPHRWDTYRVPARAVRSRTESE